ncbi:hypothetical protein LVD17_23575 [Fulvivirga ulvae]|uniref:hypothetical protein n=1 Tax=Fulvivirga ulvae TaxID=2904245 RepID=UPI001F199B01|nr:hypothetical protein [Fulvivirga ulvae]UII31276.1 hypothetical protein LVD17_23575 [Fulvivirga ulvae]
MSLQDLINWFGDNQPGVLVYFGVLLILSLALITIVNANNFNVIRYLLSAVVYAVTVPGILSAIVILYSLFILKTNLLAVNIVVYFVPVIAMILVLVIINKKVAMKRIPGFGRLSGLMIMISVAFSIVFVLQKTYFGIFLFGGFAQLLVVFAILFIILKVAWARITK